MRRDEDGRWGLPIVVDQGGDVGRYVQLRTDEFGRPHLVYTVLVDTNGFEGLRYAVGSNAAENTDHFEITVVSEQRTQGGAPVAPGLLPKTYGVRPCFNLDGSSAVIAFLDGQAGWMYLARGNQQGFQVHRLSGQFVEDGIPDPGGRYADFNRHQIGEHCAILARDGLIELVFTDERTWALLGYRGPVEGGGTIQVVDQGAIGSRTRVGASVVAARDTFGRMVIVYQDSTNNDLLLNLYTATGWLVSPVVVDGNGAIGYANSVAIQQSQALIGSVQFRTAQGGREKSEVQVYSIDLSSY